MKVQRIKPKKSDIVRARQIAWRKLWDILKFTPPLDGIVSAANGYACIDLFRLEKKIPNYNPDKCTYKGKPNYSMSMAVKEEWGEEATNLINHLL